MAEPLPSIESTRRAAIRELGERGATSGPAFDFITRSAARTSAAPVALISLIDDRFQRIISRFGLDRDELPRSESICAHTILGGEPLVVPDLRADPRFRDLPVVAGPAALRSYVGMPLELDPGIRVGTLCVLDRVPREPSATELEVLRDLGDHATELLRLHRERERARDEAVEMRRVFDAVPAYIYVKDDTNTILNLNESAAAAMKLQVDDVRGKPTEAFFPADEAAAFLADDLEVLDSGTPKHGIVEFHEGGAGERRAIRTSKLPLASRDGTRRLLAIAEDITELERTRSELQSLLEALNVGAIVATTDAKGVITHVNDVFCEISGYPREELVGQTHRIVNSGTHPKSFFVDLWRTISSGRLWRGEIQNRRKDGALYWVDTTIVPQRDADGKIERYISIRTDITEAKRRADEVRELSSLRHAILNAPQELIVSTDLDGVVTSFNTAAERALGYRADEIVGTQTPAIWHEPAEVAFHAARLSDELGIPVEPGFETFVVKPERLGVPDENEWTVIRKDGSRFPAMLTTNCIRDGSGQLLGYLGTIRDLTEEKAVAERIAEGHLRERLALDASRAGVWDYDLRTGEVHWDEAMFELYGVPPTPDGVVAYEVWSDAVLDEELADQERLLQEVIDGTHEYGRREFRIRRRESGELRHIESTETALRDASGAIVRLIGTNWDVTERVEATRLIAEAQLRYELAVEGSNDGIWDWPDIERTEEWWSPQFYRLLGYEPGEIEASLETFQELLHPDEHEACFAAVKEALGGGVPFDVAYRLRTKSDGYRWFRGRAKVFEPDDGGAIRMAGTIQDIHERHVLQEQLEQKNVELERFVYTASHDLKSPIVTISGYMRYLMDDLKEGRYDELVEFADKILGATSRMQQNIDDLLTLSRISLGDGPRGVSSLSGVVRELHVILGPQLEDRGVELVTELDHDTLACDPTHVEQVIVNLVSNAIRYGCDGPDPRIVIRAWRDGDDMVELAVEDRGPGVPAEYAEKIFGVFQQLSRRKDSTGIGLAIVARVAELYGGDAWYKDRDGGGASFRVRLPATVTADSDGGGAGVGARVGHARPSTTE